MVTLSVKLADDEDQSLFTDSQLAGWLLSAGMDIYIMKMNKNGYRFIYTSNHLHGMMDMKRRNQC